MGCRRKGTDGSSGDEASVGKSAMSECTEAISFQITLGAFHCSIELYDMGSRVQNLCILGLNGIRSQELRSLHGYIHKVTFKCRWIKSSGDKLICKRNSITPEKTIAKRPGKTRYRKPADSSSALSCDDIPALSLSPVETSLPT